MSETKLKPCPFCGGEAKIEHLMWSFDSAVICENCSARIIDEPKSAIEKWNTRKPMDNIVAEIKRCSGSGYRDVDGDYVPPMIKTETAIDIVKRGGVE